MAKQVKSEERATYDVTTAAPANLDTAQQDAVIAQAKAILEWRFIENRGEPLTSPDKVRNFLTFKLAELPHEMFCALFLDTKHRVIAFEEMFRGTIDGASVHPREVVKEALKHNAAAVIITHNHPSGVPEPSAADNALTRRLQEALAMVDVRLLDHFVVGGAETVSFTERGLI